MTASETLFANPQLEITASRNLSVAVWRNAPTVDELQQLARAAQLLAKQHPSGSGLLNLVVSGTPRFTEDVRKETMRLARDATLFPLGVARVFLLGGFAGVAVRAFLNTATLVAGKSARPLQAFTSVDEAAEWIAPKLEVGGQRWAPADIVALASARLQST